MTEVAWRMFVAETVHREDRRGTGMAAERGTEGEVGDRTETTGREEMIEGAAIIETETGKI